MVGLHTTRCAPEDTDMECHASYGGSYKEGAIKPKRYACWARKGCIEIKCSRQEWRSEYGGELFKDSEFDLYD